MSRPTLEQVRDRTYKPRDSWWTVWLVDPLASRLVRLVAPWRWVTPDLLTVAALLVGLGSAAVFARGDRLDLVIGAVLFHLSFVLDCMDGKIARLNGTGSSFGAWLDYVFDRLRVLACGIALMGGQYARTDDFAYVWLAGVVLFLDMFRYLNNLQMNQVWDQMRSDVSIAAEAPVAPDLGRLGTVRNFLQRHRIRPHLFGGIELQMFVFIVGPLLGAVMAVTIGSAIVVLLFELMLIANLYRASRRFERGRATRPA